VHCPFGGASTEHHPRFGTSSKGEREELVWGRGERENAGMSVISRTNSRTGTFIVCVN